MARAAEPRAAPRRRGRIGNAAAAVALWALGGVTAAVAAAPLDTGEGLPRRGRCPYDFRSPMPEGEFCVYRGAIVSSGGDVCAADSVVIWSTYSQAAPARASAAAGHDVFVGFADQPSLVIHDAATTRWHARLTEYSLGASHLAAPLDGHAALGGHRGRGALTLSLRLPLAHGDEATCDFAAYRGTFIGVMRRPEPGGPPARPD